MSEQDATQVETEQVQTHVTADSAQIQGAQVEDVGDDEFEEFEVDDGLKYKFPKDLVPKLKAWKEGGLREDDYRRKTHDISTRAKQIEAQEKQYSDLIERVTEGLKSLEPKKPTLTMLDPAHADYNPDQYHLQRAQYDQWAERMQAATKEKERLDREAGEKETRSKQERQAEENKKILAAIPDWKDPKKARDDAEAILNYVTKTYGVTAEDAAVLGEHAPLTIMAYKAMLHDKTVATASAQPAAAQPQKITPITKIGASRTPATRSLANIEDTGDWIAARNRQLSARK